MPKNNQLLDQIENLFSDIDLPDTNTLAHPETVPQTGVADDVANPPPSLSDEVDSPSQIDDPFSELQVTAPRGDLQARREYARRGQPIHQRRSPIVDKPASRWQRLSRQQLLLACVANGVLPALIVFLFRGTLVATVIVVALAGLAAGLVAHRVTRATSQMAVATAEPYPENMPAAEAAERSATSSLPVHILDEMPKQPGAVDARAESTKTLCSGDLEAAARKIEKRARYIEATEELNRAIGSTVEPQESMQTAVDLIRDRLELYHVALFLIEGAGERAAVCASTGGIEGHRINHPHWLAVGGDTMVGWVCAHGQARIAHDVGADAVRFDDPQLPEIHSTIVLPLAVGNRLLGALDVRSAQESAFEVEDVDGLQGMANLIAVALENARLSDKTMLGAECHALVSRVEDRLEEGTNTKEILALAVEEIGRTLDLAEATLSLGTNAGIGKSSQQHGARTDRSDPQSPAFPPAQNGLAKS